MGARFYDEALVKKINNWVKDPNLKVIKPNEVSRFFGMTADITHDEIKLPLVSLSRRGYRILNANKQVKSFDGVTLPLIDDKGNRVETDESFKLNAIPIQLEYYLDIYTMDLDECDEYARNFIFNFTNMPTGVIEIPYRNANITHKFSIHVFQDVEDNSDIPQRLFPSQFSRYTLRLIIDDAYLFSIPVKRNASIVKTELAVCDKSFEHIVEDIVVKDTDENLLDTRTHQIISGANTTIDTNNNVITSSTMKIDSESHILEI